MIDKLLALDRAARERVSNSHIFRRFFLQGYLAQKYDTQLICMALGLLMFGPLFTFLAILPQMNESDGWIALYLLLPLFAVIVLPALIDRKIEQSFFSSTISESHNIIRDLDNIEETLYNGRVRTSLMIAQLESYKLALKDMLYVPHSLLKALNDKIQYLYQINDHSLYNINRISVSEADIEDILTSEQVSGQWLINNLDIHHPIIKEKLHLIDTNKLLPCANNQDILAAIGVDASQFKQLPVDTKQMLVMHQRTQL